MQIFFDKAQSLFVDPEDDIKHVKQCIEGRTGIPAGVQRLIYSGRELDDDQSVHGAGLEASSTLHLVFRLRGGKGGFGSLLRSAGRAALTDNFDACRDLSGRRLRHVNADKKLAEWAAQARERELEKVAAKHIRDQERAAQQEAEQQVDLDDVKVAQEAALANVMSAVESGLASVPAKHKSDAAPPPAKRQRASSHMLDLDGDPSSDSDDEVDDAQPGPSDAKEVAAEAHAQPAFAKKADIPSGGNSSGSDQEALGSSLPPMHPAQEDARSVEDSTAPPSALTGASTSHMTVVDSALHTAGDSTELTVVASTAAVDHQPASPARAASTQATLNSKKRTWEPVDLPKYSSAQELETLGLEHLKAELQRRGLKAGGSLAERAARLFLLSHTPIEKIDKKQLAKPAQK